MAALVDLKMTKDSSFFLRKSKNEANFEQVVCLSAIWLLQREEQIDEKKRKEAHIDACEREIFVLVLAFFLSLSFYFLFFFGETCGISLVVRSEREMKAKGGLFIVYLVTRPDSRQADSPTAQQPNSPTVDSSAARQK